MERCRWLLALSLAVSFLAGCSGSSAPNQAGAGKGSKMAADGPSPADAVHEFLEAVRKGDDSKANSKLTTLARREVEKQAGGFAPKASDTAKYEVGEFEYTTEEKNVAHVASKWTDLMDGKVVSTDYLWELHKEESGWGIAGVLFKVFDDTPPLVLDFENGEEMLQKLNLTSQEMQRRMIADMDKVEKSQEVATKPGETTQPAQK